MRQAAYAADGDVILSPVAVIVVIGAGQNLDSVTIFCTSGRLAGIAVLLAGAHAQCVTGGASGDGRRCF